MNILFDLDGTLTDSRRGIVACIQHALTALGQPIPAANVLEAMIGPPLRDGFSELLAIQREEALVDEAIRLYRERFATVGLFENEVYDGIPPVLAALAAQRRLFVATSKPRVFAKRILEHFGLADYFTAIYGSELDGHLADKGALIAHALADANLRAEETVMVGDRRHDVLGALQNQVLPVGVLWGYGSPEELTTAGVRQLLTHPRDLVHLGDSTPTTSTS